MGTPRHFVRRTDCRTGRHADWFARHIFSVRHIALMFAVCCCVVVCAWAAFSGTAKRAYADETSATSVGASANSATAPVYSKTITRQSDGTYELAMNVTGKSTETATQQVQPLDIALVFDVSGSMDEPSSYTQVSYSSLNSRGTYYVRSSEGTYQQIQYQYSWPWGAYWTNAETGDTISPSDPIYVGSGSSRLQVLKNSADNFMKKVAEQNAKIQHNKIQVSLVKYAGDQSDYEGNDQYFPYRVNCGTNGCNYSQIVSHLTTDTAAISSDINALKAGGPTQSDYGLGDAEDALTGQNGNRSGVRRLVIFYSDGEPNASRGFDTTVANSAIKQSYDLKRRLNATVYAIGAMGDADPTSTTLVNEYMNYVSSNFPDATSMRAPGNGGMYGGQYYRAASSASQLQNVFDTIITQAVAGTAVDRVSMEDTLSQYAEFTQPETAHYGAQLHVYDPQGKEVTPASVGLADGQGNVTARITSDPSTRSVGIAFPDSYILLNGYRYSLQYPVVPSSSAYELYANNTSKDAAAYTADDGVAHQGDPETGADSAHKDGFRSNDHATLTYTPRVNGQELAQTSTRFAHPVLQLDETQMAHLTISKRWLGAKSSHANVKQVVVNVHCALAQGGACQGYDHVALSADGNWTRAIAIPQSSKERTFTVTEEPVDGYRTAYDTHRTWTLAANAAGESSTVVTNYPDSAPVNLNAIRVGKTVANTDTDDSFSFTLTPQQAAGSAGNAAEGSAGTARKVASTATIAGPFTQGQQRTAVFSGTTTMALGEQGSDNHLDFEVAEQQPGSAWQADTDTVHVRLNAVNDQGVPQFNNDGSLRVTVTYTYGANDADHTAANNTLAAFTNRLRPATQLPVTGQHGATALVWIGVGGSLGALALASFGIAEWRRKRHDA